MKEKDRQKLLLVVLVLILFSINYPFLDKTLEKFLAEEDFVLVERVIDGDTFAIENTSVRLLGINTPEKGELYYQEAKEFLEDLVLNKTVRLEFGKDKRDRYDRILAYIYINRENINLKLIEEGLANYYFPSGKDEYYNEFRNAWEECIDEDVNLCQASINRCGRCIELRELSVDNQRVVLYNGCGLSCELSGWSIKDEGRKIFVFEDFNLKANDEVKIKVGEGSDTRGELFWTGEKYVWTSSGDTLFLRDDEGKLVLWENY